ncbi:DUF7130 family rubredoxin-like protein [Halostella litorea]|uniref:DUF7130 family rubredoxin-like protein n=1 Tax=Halostella litorea TaxID=2528831 RepID=UPI001091DD2E|nr:hypothetical protein [Halostella litorea]
MSLEHERPGTGNRVEGNKDETEIPIGEVGELGARDHAMWQCGDCGEMGELGGTLPERCPACAASRESLHYRQED